MTATRGPRGSAAGLRGVEDETPSPGAASGHPAKEVWVSRCGDLYENKVTGERAVVLRGDEDGHGQPGLVHLTVQPHGAVVGEHIHPQFRERFLVISGRLGTRVDGVERTLVAGQEATAAAGSAHDWWNAGKEEAQVLVEFLPQSPRFGLMIGNMFGLANAGRTNAKGMPGLLQLAVIGREFQDVMRFTRPPRAVQTVMFGLLGPLGRLRGYRGSYPEYSHPQGHTAPDPAVLAIAGLAPPDDPHAGAEA
jgi:quercetin dioxygenase-like cupin family protein